MNKWLEQSGEVKNDELEKTLATIEKLKKDLKTYSNENYERLNEHAKAIHHKAFTTNLCIF